MKKVLYITYDGLTDPLGQSQILPYLKGLAEFGYKFTVLSFEKNERYQQQKDHIRSLTDESGIEWVPLFFTSRPPLLSKFYDAVRMRNKAASLQRLNNFEMVHCRSYIAADVGLYLKRKFRVKFFFDMRGFCADEKKDGSWNISNPLFRQVYKYYKKKEAQYLQHADYIIALTNAGKKEMSTWDAFNKEVPLNVIPCCADMDLFSLTDKEQKRQSRAQLKIDGDRLVVSYLGSVGTWYMLDEMLHFFSKLKEKYADALFLFITHSNHQFIQNKIIELGLNTSDFIIKEGSRKEVPMLIKASDINISFIKPVYSKISSSPTKLGEVLSMGIPVICNSGVGDVAEIVTKANAGFILNEFTDAEYEKAINSVPALVQKEPADIRKEVEPIFSLKNGIQSYLSCYRKILN